MEPMLLYIQELLTLWAENKIIRWTGWMIVVVMQLFPKCCTHVKMRIQNSTLLCHSWSLLNAPVLSSHTVHTSLLSDNTQWYGVILEGSSLQTITSGECTCGVYPRGVGSFESCGLQSGASKDRTCADPISWDLEAQSIHWAFYLTSHCFWVVFVVWQSALFN